MTILCFADSGWEVATASWSAGCKRAGITEVHYLWFTISDQGVAQITFNVGLTEFLAYVDDVTRNGRADIHELQRRY